MCVCFSSPFFVDLIDAYDGGSRSVVGETATAGLFTSFPHKNISKVTGFFDVVSSHYAICVCLTVISIQSCRSFPIAVGGRTLGRD